MMDARSVALGELRVVLLDSVSLLSEEHAGAIVVTGSHGGIGSARQAIRHPPRLIVFNDAGVGKDAAGISGLSLLAGFHIAAATVSADSARIGDADDGLEHGVVSHVNGEAEALGIRPGLRLRQALAELAH